MAREITSHRAGDAAGDALRVEALDLPSEGGAPHRYRISPTAGNATGTLLEFQHGPVQAGVANGLTIEALLAVCEDRLLGFQTGAFACSENSDAIVAIRQAMAALHTRTKARMARGVEGTRQP